MEYSVELGIEILKKLAVVVRVLQTRQSFAEDTKKFAKIYNACVQPLFWSLNLPFNDVPVAVAFVVFFNSLIRGTCPASKPNK